MAQNNSLADDDLDDLLDEFSEEITIQVENQNQLKNTSKNTSKNTTQPTIENTVQNEIKNNSSTNTESNKDINSEEINNFNKDLQNGMSDLLSSLETDPDAMREFEQLMSQFKNLEENEVLNKSTDNSSKTNRTQQNDINTQAASFQETMAKTMERIKESGSNQTNSNGSIDESELFLQELVKQFEGLANDDNGDTIGDEKNNTNNSNDSNDNLINMLTKMMGQLTQKEILYEPMKELSTNYPSWLAENAKSLPKDELERYTKQYGIIREIVGKFEENTYSDDKPDDHEFILKRMAEMQDSGAPPSELMGGQDESIFGGQGGLPAGLDGGCPVQ